MPDTISSQCPQMGASRAVHSRESFGGGPLDGVSGTLGFPLARRVSLVLVTMLVVAVGSNRTLLQRLLGIRPRFSARSIRQPRRVPHCSRHFAFKQTMSSEGGSCLMSFYLSQGLRL